MFFVSFLYWIFYFKVLYSFSITGVVDSSGVRIMYSEKLRQHDAGILTLGHTVSPTHIIPPGQKWTTVALCTADCTDEVISSVVKRIFLMVQMCVCVF